MTGHVPASFLVALDRYHGPLDLLLYLVRKNELDILDIPIATITAQFQEFLATIQELWLEQAGEFLVAAAWLIEIKSRMLVDQPQNGTSEPPPLATDPRAELVQRLVEYRQLKAAVELLAAQASRQGSRLFREEPDAATPSRSVCAVELWDLVAAFARLMREIQPVSIQLLQPDDTPQQVYEEELYARIRDGGCIPFRQVFVPPYTRPRLIGLFLALLELIRRNAIAVGFDQQGGIWLSASQSVVQSGTLKHPASEISPEVRHG